MTASSLSEPFQRLAYARRQAGFQTASDAARAFGWNENTYRSHENGERGLRLDTAYKYAKAFKIDVKYILLGDETKDLSEGNGRDIVGFIDENGSFHEYPAHGVDGFGRHVALTSLRNDGSYWYAEIKSGRPVLGCQPGDLIVVFNSSVHEGNWRNFAGNLVIAEIDSGQQVFRRLRPAHREDLIDIQLNADMSPEYARIRFVSPVYAIIQQKFWGKVTRQKYEADPQIRLHVDERS